MATLTPTLESGRMVSSHTSSGSTLIPSCICGFFPVFFSGNCIFGQSRKSRVFCSYADITFCPNIVFSNVFVQITTDKVKELELHCWLGKYSGRFCILMGGNPD